MSVLQETFTAWIDSQPPGPQKLIVTGDIEVPTSGWSAKLTRATPQGVNPAVIILELALTKPTGNVLQVVSRVKARYEESPPGHAYTEATIRHEKLEFSIPVKPTS
ncbi:MAG: hypothetical protein Q7V40_19685 [Pseudolabrys sp.]|nr:hypothetical protein [Pseudolabrys sp.]